jgi:hypothetical protein
VKGALSTHFTADAKLLMTARHIHLGSRKMGNSEIAILKGYYFTDATMQRLAHFPAAKKM